MGGKRLGQLTAFVSDRPMGGDTMAVMIGHGVKQPLHAMTTNADAGLRWLNRSMPDVDEAREAFKQIMADAQRLAMAIAVLQAMFEADALDSGCGASPVDQV